MLPVANRATSSRLLWKVIADRLVVSSAFQCSLRRLRTTSLRASGG